MLAVIHPSPTKRKPVVARPDPDLLFHGRELSLEKKKNRLRDVPESLTRPPADLGGTMRSSTFIGGAGGSRQKKKRANSVLFGSS